MAGLTDQFSATVSAQGLWTALRWLNSKVPYRHTAVFAFDGSVLRNICLIDKDDSAVTRCDDQAITDSYCVYIHQSAARFSVEEALQDSRVAGHPKQTSYQCYYGIPLMGKNGNLLGTVCHFNAQPVCVTDEVVTALDDLAPLIAEAAFSTKPNHSTV